MRHLAESAATSRPAPDRDPPAARPDAPDRRRGPDAGAARGRPGSRARRAPRRRVAPPLPRFFPMESEGKPPRSTEDARPAPASDRRIRQRCHWDSARARWAGHRRRAAPPRRPPGSSARGRASCIPAPETAPCADSRSRFPGLRPGRPRRRSGFVQPSRENGSSPTSRSRAPPLIIRRITGVSLSLAGSIRNAASSCTAICSLPSNPDARSPLAGNRPWRRHVRELLVQRMRRHLRTRTSRRHDRHRDRAAYPRHEDPRHSYMAQGPSSTLSVRPRLHRRARTARNII